MNTTEIKLNELNKHQQKKTKIMAILNLTPDSFSDGGKFNDPNDAFKRIEGLINDGADIIDIGAESTRPGAEPISAEEEYKRLEPVLKDIKKEFPKIQVSLDTTKAEIAKFGCDCGVDIINDVSGLKLDPKMASSISSYDVSVVVMHMKGTPQTMQHNPHYSDLVNEVKTSIQESIQIGKNHSISKFIVDPGIGFGKTIEHNLVLLNHLDKFKEFGYEIMIGTSKKSFIGTLLGTEVDDRLEGSISSNVVAVMKGASIVRVHDVKEMRKALGVVDAIIGV